MVQTTRSRMCAPGIRGGSGGGGRGFGGGGAEGSGGGGEGNGSACTALTNPRPRLRRTEASTHMSQAMQHCFERPVSAPFAGCTRALMDRSSSVSRSMRLRNGAADGAVAVSSLLLEALAFHVSLLLLGADPSNGLPSSIRAKASAGPAARGLSGR